MADAQHVKSARRAVALLELLIVERRPLSLTEISDSLGVPKSSTHALLSTLLAADVIRRNSEGDSYQIAPRWHQLMGSATVDMDESRLDRLRDTAHPELARLSREFNATCNLAILTDHHVVYLDKVDSHNNPIQLKTRVGSVFPAHATALGKVLVAAMPADERDAWMEKHEFSRLTNSTISTVSEFTRELDKVNRKGYAMDVNEFHPGIMCVAAGIRAASSVGASAAISVTGTTSSMEEIGPDRIGQSLTRSAEKIAAELG